jgi:hypothetical protein
MGRVRTWGFQAVIGVGGTGAEPRSHGLDGKVNWIGIGPHKMSATGKRGPVVTFDHFLFFGSQGPDFEDLAPQLAERIYAKNVRVLLAEDNLVNQRLALKQLKKLGYHGSAVANGCEVLTALEQIRLNAIEVLTEIVAIILAAARLQQFDRSDRPRSLVLEPDGEGFLGESIRFLWGEDSSAKLLHVRSNSWNLVEDSEARFGHFIRRETAVPNGNTFEGRVGDDHSVATHEAEQARVKLIRTAAVV